MGQKSISKAKMFIQFLFIACFIVFNFSSEAFAAGGITPGNTLKDWIWRIVNFAILVFILVKFAGKPLRDFLRQRKELIEKSLKEAQEARELAAKALSEVEERLKLKDKEIEDIISSAKISGEKEKERLIEEGNKLSQKIIEQAKTNIEFEIKRAKDIIKEEVVNAAIKLAEEKIRTRLTKEDQENLLRESIKLLERKN